MFQWVRILKVFVVIAVLSAMIMPFAMARAADDDELWVRAIAVQGNVHIDTDLILEQITATKVDEPLSEEHLQADVMAVIGMGYFEEVEPRLTAFQDGVRVTLIVKEFPVIREVVVHVKDEVVPGESVAALLDVTIGEPLNAVRFNQALMDLPLRASEELGYSLSFTDVELAGAEGERLVVYVTPVYVGNIIIEGNVKTKESVIRRELTFGPGDVLSFEKVRDSLRRLGQLGYFEPIAPDFLATDDPYVADVLIPVTETKTGRAAFGVGYSSRDGLLGYIEVSDRNLFGRGQTANVKWEFGGTSNIYDLGFTEPYLFGTKTSAGFNLYRTMRTDRDALLTRTRIGGDVTIGRPLGQFVRGYLTLKVDNLFREPLEGSTEPPSSNKTRSIIVGTRADTTDSFYYPTDGYRHDFSVEAARPIFDGDTNFTKYQTSFSKYFQVGSNRQTLAFRGILGIGTGEIPYEDEYLVGGADTVRGYRYGAMRGDQMFVAQGEYRVPISDKVTGVLFVDAGNAWKGQKIDLSDLKFAGGIGVRFDTPLGIIRLDYGIGEDGGELNFSLGPSF